MAKAKQNRPAAPADPTKRGIGRRFFLNLAAFLALSACVAAVVRVVREEVEKRYTFPPNPPKVVLLNRPAWMSDALAARIVDTARPAGAHSAFDHQLLVDTAEALKSNPWVKEVRQVRRAYGERPGDTLDVDCAYRVPTALVKWQDYFWLIDGDGFKLPEQYTRDEARRAMVDGAGKLTLRVIEGVAHPPVEQGNLWPGDDLAAGLELVKLLADKPFAEEAPVVDVTNFGRRRDAAAAQIVLVTRYGTTIRWGRPPSAKDFFVEVPTSQKLQALSDIFEQMHRIDGGQPWIDIRSDTVTYPSPEPRTAHADDR